MTIVTTIPAGPGTALYDFRIVEATEIVKGKAVVVIAEHEDGSIGVGNLVRTRSQSPASARQKCLEHAIHRIVKMRGWRAQQEREKRLDAEATDYRLIKAAGLEPL